MTIDLPITLEINQQIMSDFIHMQVVGEKLAAQLNFQTLTAGWYGNEQDIIKVHLVITTPQHLLTQQGSDLHGQLTVFSDDVISFYQGNIKQITCYVAITDSEQKQLLATAKLSKVFMYTKLKKVLSLIAKQQGLAVI